MKKFSLLFITLIFFGFHASAQFRKSREKVVTQPAVANDLSILNYAKPTEYFIGGIEIKGLQVLDKNAMISLT
jgi:hypothetical protein